MNAAPKNDNAATVPTWIKWIYGIVGASLIPWIYYLQCTLPPQQLILNWRTMWVGFDIILFLLIALTLYFLHKKVRWASLTLMALGTLLLADAWFDVFTANGSSELMAASLAAIAAEIPLAILSMWFAVRLLRKSEH